MFISSTTRGPSRGTFRNIYRDCTLQPRVDHPGTSPFPTASFIAMIRKSARRTAGEIRPLARGDQAQSYGKQRDLTPAFSSRRISSCIYLPSVGLIVPATPFLTRNPAEVVTIEPPRSVSTTLDPRVLNPAEQMKPHLHRCPMRPRVRNCERVRSRVKQVRVGCRASGHVR